MSHIESFILNDVTIYLMEITCDEVFYAATLTEQEKEKLSTINHPLKRLEFTASRYLKHHIFGSLEITYHPDSGCPIISNNNFISISHCKGYVALAVSPHLVGLDLEHVRDKSVQVASKYIHESEKKHFNVNSADEMSRLWSIKECLYKLSDRKALHFNKDIIVEKTGNNWVGFVLTKSGRMKYNIYIYRYKNIFVTFNLSKGELQR
ncbi:MAG TPA: 4'-phosphopantetheinyl transferase superfamily protein [Fluviicola sp.]|nr:4'-phosphopantetheinyl transferase superfamily protein [Fluviicola sp.]